MLLSGIRKPLILLLLLACSVSVGSAQQSFTAVDSLPAVLSPLSAGLTGAERPALSSDSLGISHAPLTAPEINYGRLSLIGGGLLGTMVAVHFYQQNGWWKNNRSSFHFREDLKYGLSVDKIGHFYAAMGLTFLISRSVEWSNVPRSTAIWYGAGGALLFQTFMEIEDGFSTWGFDRVDFAADIGGAALPVLQHMYPHLADVQLKFSYRPSSLLNSAGGTGFRGQQHLMMDDYEGQTFWLSARVNNFLPSSIEPYWPDFLCLAVGFGARNIAVRGVEPHNVILLGLDYDLTEVLPKDGSFWRTLADALNFIHLPAPAVQISPSAVWYGLQY